MTDLETRTLAVGDLVSCGEHIGRVVKVTAYSVSIEWSEAVAIVHQRDKMTAVRWAGIDLGAENGHTPNKG